MLEPEQLPPQIISQLRTCSQIGCFETKQQNKFIFEPKQAGVPIPELPTQMMWPWQKCHVLRITPSPKHWGCLIGSEEFAKGALGRKESESKSGWPLESLDGII